MTATRRLYLLRHAKSSWDDPSVEDFDRPLAGRGRRGAELMARHLAAARIRPALVLCSAARRARQTLELVEPALEGVPVAIEPDLYAADKAELLVRLRRLDDHLGSVMLVGHNPGLERLAEGLIARHGDGEALARFTEKFPTGALAVLDCDLAHWAELEDGTCRLAEFVRPADLDREAEG